MLTLLGKTGKSRGETEKSLGKTGKSLEKTGKSLGKTGKSFGKTGKSLGKTGRSLGKTEKSLGKTGKSLRKTAKKSESARSSLATMLSKVKSAKSGSSKLSLLDSYKAKLKARYPQANQSKLLNRYKADLAAKAEERSNNLRQTLTKYKTTAKPTHSAKLKVLRKPSNGPKSPVIVPQKSTKPKRKHRKKSSVPRVPNVPTTLLKKINQTIKKFKKPTHQNPKAKNPHKSLASQSANRRKHLINEKRKLLNSFIEKIPRSLKIYRKFKIPGKKETGTELNNIYYIFHGFYLNPNIFFM